MVRAPRKQSRSTDRIEAHEMIAGRCTPDFFLLGFVI